MAKEIEFVNGLIVKAPHEKAPEYVKATISIKVADLDLWLREKYKAGQEWVNVDVKESRSGKWHAAVNTYKKEEANPASGLGRRPAPMKQDADPFADMDDDIPL